MRPVRDRLLAGGAGAAASPRPSDRRRASSGSSHLGSLAHPDALPDDDADGIEKRIHETNPILEAR